MIRANGPPRSATELEVVAALLESNISKLKDRHDSMALHRHIKHPELVRLRLFMEANEGALVFLNELSACQATTPLHHRPTDYTPYKDLYNLNEETSS